MNDADPVAIDTHKIELILRDGRRLPITNAGYRTEDDAKFDDLGKAVYVVAGEDDFWLGTEVEGLEIIRVH